MVKLNTNREKYIITFPGGSVVPKPAAKQKTQVLYPSWKIPRRMKWQPTPVVFPGKSHGQRSLVGYGPWSCKESDMTQQLNHNHNGNSFSFFPSYVIDSSNCTNYYQQMWMIVCIIHSVTCNSILTEGCTLIINFIEPESF